MNFSKWIRARFNVEKRFLLISILCGLVCGLVAVAFHLSIHFVFENLWHWASGYSGWGFYAVMLTAPSLAGLIVGVVTQRYVPEAIGSGIPQTKEAYYNKGASSSSVSMSVRAPATTPSWRTEWPVSPAC
jgi:chloride channel protein, CIC family